MSIDFADWLYTYPYAYPDARCLTRGDHHGLDLLRHAALTAFDRAGVRYAPLAEALSYGVYHGQYDISGVSVLTQAGHRLGTPLPPAPSRPTALLDQVCGG